MNDPELEVLLDAFEEAKTRLEVRGAIIQEALVELPTADYVILHSFLSGRALAVTEAVRGALEASAKEELEALKAKVEAAKAAIRGRQAHLANQPT